MVTKREGAIISAFTGVLMVDFDIMHEYIEEILDREVFVHELGIKEVAEEVKEAARSDFIKICEETDKEGY